MRTKHPDILLPDFVRGRLDAQTRAEVEQHLATCQLCRTELRDMQETFTALENEGRAKVPESYFATVLPRVRQRLDRKKKFFAFEGPLVGRVLLPLGVVAVLMVVLWRLPSVWNETETENPLLTAMNSSSVDDIADVLQEDTPSRDLNVVNQAILSDALSNDQFVRQQLVSEALNNENVSPFDVFSDVTPQEVLADLQGPDADKLMHQLENMEVL